MVNLGGLFQVRTKISDQSGEGCLLRRKGTAYSADPGVPSIVGSVTSSTMTPTILSGSLGDDFFVCGLELAFKDLLKSGALCLSPNNVASKSE